jgi:hypothetical protein
MDNELLLATCPEQDTDASAIGTSAIGASSAWQIFGNPDQRPSVLT